MLKKFIAFTVGGAVLLACLGLGLVWYIGAWNLVFPNSAHDSQPPELPAELQRPAVLVFSKTNGFRHKEGIAAGHRLMRELAADLGWGHFATENGAVFTPEALARFDVVVFNSASGDMLSEPQEAAFQQWLQGGGGWIGIHAAGDGSHASWGWYVQNLLGAEFTAHIMDPQFQAATVEVEQPEHPVMDGLPASWSQTEEWYSWAASPRLQGMTPLATVDEESYSPEMRFMGQEMDLRMGDNPVVWINCPGAGRSLYAAMGHRADAFDVPQYRRLLGNALRWAAGEGAAGCGAAP